VSLDPVHHVLDEYVLGLSSGGDWVFLWRDPEALAAFQPARLGPFDIVLTKHMLSISLVAILVFTVMSIVAARIRESVAGMRAPRGRLVNLIEAMVLFVRDEMVIPNMGERGVKYIPVFLTFFFFILLSNLLGLIPEIGTSTGNINVTASLAGMIFLLIFILGSIEQGGPHRFFRNLVPHGLPFWLVPLMFVIELIGPVAKCFALAMRLFANMIAGHIVIAALLSLGILFQSIAVGSAAALGAMAMGLLEVFVCILQAYIFTLLSIVFIGAAIHPEH